MNFSIKTGIHQSFLLFILLFAGFGGVVKLTRSGTRETAFCTAEATDPSPKQLVVAGKIIKQFLPVSVTAGPQTKTALFHFTILENNN